MKLRWQCFIICFFTQADKLVTVGSCVQLFMAMVGWVGSGIEVVECMHAGQSHGRLVACREMPEHFPCAR